MQFLDEPTFDQLRTKEQLGYVVHSGHRKDRFIHGAFFNIQSPSKNCTHIRTRLDLHLMRMRTKVQQISDEDFQTNIGAVMTTVAEKDKNLEDDFYRNWSEITMHAQKFDRQQTQIETLKTLTKVEFIEHFEKLFFKDNRANRFDMFWNSQPHINNQQPASEEESKQDEDEGLAAPLYESERQYSCANAFKKSMGLYADKVKLDFISKNHAVQE